MRQLYNITKGINKVLSKMHYITLVVTEET